MRVEDVALVVIDVQNDFCPGGALEVPFGDAVVPIINRLVPRFAACILTQDWHPPGHRSFASSHPDRAPFETTELASTASRSCGPTTACRAPPEPPSTRTSRPPEPTSSSARAPARDRFLLGVLRERPPHAHRPCRVSPGTRHLAPLLRRPRDRFLRRVVGHRRGPGRLRGDSGRGRVPRHRPRRLARRRLGRNARRERRPGPRSRSLKPRVTPHREHAESRRASPRDQSPHAGVGARVGSPLEALDAKSSRDIERWIVVIIRSSSCACSSIATLQAYARLITGKPGDRRESPVPAAWAGALATMYR